MQRFQSILRLPLKNEIKWEQQHLDDSEIPLTAPSHGVGPAFAISHPSPHRPNPFQTSTSAWVLLEDAGPEHTAAETDTGLI